MRMIITKRAPLPGWVQVLVPVGAILVTLLLSAVPILFAGGDLWLSYTSLFRGALGTRYNFLETCVKAAPLTFTGLAVAFAFRAKFWNIGAEGQVLIGGIAAAACMIYLGKSLPTMALIVIMFFGSAVAGGVWGTIPAVFKARWNANETLFTLMMNYIAIQLTSFFVAKWEHPFGSNTVGIINQMTKAGWFPTVFGQMYTLNIMIVLTLTVLMYLYLRYSKQGYEIAVVGESENTARYAAINVKKVIIRTMALSGAICGVAGFVAVAGASHTISTNTAGGRGFTAIIVAWLSKFNTFVMIGIAALLVFLDKGAIEIASQFDLNDFVAEMITGIILFFVLGSEFFINYKIRFRGGRKEAGK